MLTKQNHLASHSWYDDCLWKHSGPLLPCLIICHLPCELLKICDHALIGWQMFGVFVHLNQPWFFSVQINVVLQDLNRPTFDACTAWLVLAVFRWHSTHDLKPWNPWSLHIKINNWAQSHAVTFKKCRPPPFVEIHILNLTMCAHVKLQVHPHPTPPRYSASCSYSCG